MLIAVLVGCIALFLTLLYDRKVNNWGFIVAMILLSIFCAIRWEWGNDMVGNANIFEQYGIENVKFWDLEKISVLNVRADRSNEIGWSILNILCQPVGFFGMTILLSFFEGFVVYWFIKKYVPRGYVTFAVFLYTFNPNLMVLGCSMMRQWLAICLILIAASLLEKKRYFYYVLVVILASAFHSSALFCLIFPFLSLMRNVRFSSTSAISFSLLILVWIFFFGRFMGDAISPLFQYSFFSQYELYIHSSMQTATVGLGSFMNIIVCLLCFFLLNKGTNEMKVMAWVYSGYLIILPFVTLIPLASRIIFYFEGFSLAVIPNGIKYSKNNPAKWFIVIWIIFWYIYMYVGFFNAKVWRDAYMEYHTIFEAPFWM